MAITKNGIKGGVVRQCVEFFPAYSCQQSLPIAIWSSHHFRFVACWGSRTNARPSHRGRAGKRSSCRSVAVYCCCRCLRAAVIAVVIRLLVSGRTLRGITQMCILRILWAGVAAGGGRQLSHARQRLQSLTLVCEPHMRVTTPAPA